MSDYVTVAEVSEFAADYGDEFEGTTEDQEAAIRRAQLWIDGQEWQGQKTDGRDQEDQWPRTGVSDADGFSVDSGSVPFEIKNATSILAIFELANPGALSPDVTINQIERSVTVGPISVTFADGGVGGARPVVTRALDALRPLLRKRTNFLERA